MPTCEAWTLRRDMAATNSSLLIPSASLEQASVVADRIRAEFKQASTLILKKSMPVSMSVGVATIVNNHPSSADQLVALADQALYRAKELGRDQIAAADSLSRLIQPAGPILHH